MPNGWENYYVVLVAAAIAMIVPAFLVILSQFSKRSHGKVSIEPDTGYAGKINARFFGPLISSLILMSFALLLIPCVVAVKPAGDPSGAVSRHAVFAVLSILIFVGLALIYAVKKKDVSWNMSSRTLSHRGDRDDV